MKFEWNGGETYVLRNGRQGDSVLISVYDFGVSIFHLTDYVMVRENMNYAFFPSGGLRVSAGSLPNIEGALAFASCGDCGLPKKVKGLLACISDAWEKRDFEVVCLD